MAFLPKGVKRHEREGARLSEAIAGVEVAIDADLGAMAGERRRSRWGWPIPSADEYAHALHALEPSDLVRRMLSAHMRAPDRTMTATQLAEAAGAASHSVTNLHDGKFGRDLAELLRLPAPEYKPGHPIWTGALAESLDGLPDDPDFRWAMYPDLAEALERAGLA